MGCEESVCTAKEFALYPEDTGEPLKEFKQRSGRFTSFPRLFYNWLCRVNRGNGSREIFFEAVGVILELHESLKEGWREE